MWLVLIDTALCPGLQCLPVASAASPPHSTALAALSGVACLSGIPSSPTQPYLTVLAALLALRCAIRLPLKAPAIQPHLTALKTRPRPTFRHVQCLPSSHSPCHSAQLHSAERLVRPAVPEALPGLQRWLPCFQELDDRRKFLEALSEKYTVSGIPEPGPMVELPPLPEEEAILVIQVGVLCSGRDCQWAATCSASTLSSQVFKLKCCIVSVQTLAAALSLTVAMCVSAGPALRGAVVPKTAAMSPDLEQAAACCMSVRRPVICYSMD